MNQLSWLTGPSPGCMLDWYERSPDNPSRSGGTPLPWRKATLIACATIRRIAAVHPEGLSGALVRKHGDGTPSAVESLEDVADSDSGAMDRFLSGCGGINRVARSYALSNQEVATVVRIFDGIRVGWWRSVQDELRQWSSPFAGTAGLDHFGRLATGVIRSQLGDPFVQMFVQETPHAADVHPKDGGTFVLLSDAGRIGWDSRRLIHGGDHPPDGPRRHLVRMMRHEWWAGPAGDLAMAIYRSRRFEELPILADLLERHGCEEATFLDALRGRAVCASCSGFGYHACLVCNGGFLAGSDPKKRNVYDVGRHPYRSRDVRDGGAVDGAVCSLCSGSGATVCFPCNGKGKIHAPPPSRGFWALDFTLASWGRLRPEPPGRTPEDFRR